MSIALLDIIQSASAVSVAPEIIAAATTIEESEPLSRLGTRYSSAMKG
jgi:hypothetical protein